MEMFVRELVEEMVSRVILQDGVEKHLMLEDTLREFTIWVIEQVLSGETILLHDKFCSLGETMAEIGYSVKQVHDMHSDLRRAVRRVRHRDECDGPTCLQTAATSGRQLAQLAVASRGISVS